MSKSKVTIGHVFKTIIWPRRGLVAIGLLLVMISSGAGLVSPYLTKDLIDDVIIGKSMTDLPMLIGLIFGAVTIQAVTSFLLTRILSVEAQHLIAKLRVQVQKQILRMPVRYFDNEKTGALVSRIMTDVEGVRNLVGTGLAQMTGGIITSILSFGFLISISPMMTLYTLVPIALFGFISLKAFGYIRPIFRDRSVINAEVTGRLTETLNGVRVIKGFNAENQEIASFERGVEKLFQNIKKSLTSTALLTSSGAFLIGLATAGILGIGGYLSNNDGISTGEIISFIFFLAIMVAPILQMGNIGSQLTESFAGLDRTEEIMNMQVEEDPEVRTVEMPEIIGDIKFDNVSYAYNEGKDVLKKISFNAPKGSVTALVGTSGSGKSTIAGLVASFLNADSGKITIDGVDLNTVKLGSYRSQMGVVLQDDFLFEGTIKENILFPRPNASEEQLQEAVKAAHVNEFTDRFDEGLETMIGERGVKLSGGQRQRIAIARAILADPRILILDEATSNLDTESETLIQESLKRLMVGRTTFVIAHRLSTIKQADQILVIEQGQIEEKGTHDELIEKQGRYYELFTYQARI